MARASNIYIVEDITTNEVLGAFTVKHEAITFVRRYHFSIADNIIFRVYRDGRGKEGYTEYNFDTINV